MLSIANSHNLPIDEMLKNLQDKLESDINDIKREVECIPQLEEKFKEMNVIFFLVIKPSLFSFVIVGVNQ